MPNDPFYIKLLDKLGVNTTRLRWKLYQLEKRAAHTRETGGLPTWLQWLRYEHKICARCGAVNDRNDRRCHRCERKLPGVLGYRVMRLFGLMTPAGAPVTCYTFLTVMVIFFGIELVFDGMSALLNPSTGILYVLGAYSNDLHNGLAPWRLLSFGLIHAGILHIGFNAFATTQIGPVIEGSLGRRRMLVLITMCQLCSAFASYFWYQQVQNAPFLTVGASGWVFGLIGFGVAWFHRTGQHMYRNMLAQWAVYALLFGILIGANNAAHIGGFLGGAILSGIPGGRGFSPDEKDPVWSVAFWICLAAWIGAIGMSLTMLVTHAGDLLNR